MTGKNRSRKTREPKKRHSRKRKARDEIPGSDPMSIDTTPEPSENPVNAEKIFSFSVKAPKFGETIVITDDTDFASDDYDGRIKRCEERIKAGYAKSTFEQQLRENHAGEQQGLGCVSTVGCSTNNPGHLEKIEDPAGKVPNVIAIIAAYQSRQLEWDGLTTYWAQGEMIGGPSPFAWSDFRRLNTQENRGNGGFWVEGILHLGPSQRQHAMRYNSTTIVPGSNGMIELDLVIRLDQSLSNEIAANTDYLGVPFPQLSLKFEDDTGADIMAITNIDQTASMGNDAAISLAPLHRLMGYLVVGQADGSQIVFKTIAVQVNMVGRNDNGDPQYMLDTWTSVACVVYDDPPPPAPPVSHRLCGPWLRSMFYVASAPEFPPHIYAATTKSALMESSMLRVVLASRITEPEWHRPRYGAGWNFDTTTGKWTPHPIEGPGRIPPHTERYDDVD
ncbi:uncharacterized protein N7483_009154 [Penicillium malachiteum]|uniref:uncharacterized protein n=1 Tax=Penicillium malachiteum TaxID=1324776 RepID=UPI0025469698|nr:uncharacterized protein N7483_009154 [Penicillium malachiteum]KAJ5721220.1 hypothetical protein N7483_009154 [Penicillium malachiteum]